MNNMSIVAAVVCAWGVSIACAGPFDNRWPATGADANPAIAKAMAAVRAGIAATARDDTRPVYHFRPPARWMNDPCGAIYHKGYYHVFYQLNPTGDTWGADNTHWAHTRSRDLVNWQHLPIAIWPSRELGERRCNSGCVVLDGAGRPVVFYTYVPLKRGASRQQWIAVGDDDLIAWKKHSGNPVLDRERSGVPLNVVRPGWSDPFVFRADGRTFVTFKSCGGVVCEAVTPDLTRWKYVGRLTGVDGECPNFFRLQGKWVLLISGSRSSRQLQYRIGSFDPSKLRFTAEASGILDHSYGPKTPNAWTRGFYATNILFDKAGRCVLFGWVSGFKPGRGWNGCLGLPRVLSIGPDGRPRQTPAPQLQTLRGRHVRLAGLTLSNRSHVLEGAGGDTIEILAELAPGDAKACGLRVRRSADGSRAVPFRWDGRTLDAAGTRVPLSLGKDKTLRLHVFLDKSVMELFVNGGREAVTRVIYPGEKDLGIEVFSEGGTASARSVDVWQMKSIWP